MMFSNKHKTSSFPTKPIPDIREKFCDLNEEFNNLTGIIHKIKSTREQSDEMISTIRHGPSIAFIQQRIKHSNRLLVNLAQFQEILLQSVEDAKYLQRSALTIRDLRIHKQAYQFAIKIEQMLKIYMEQFNYSDYVETIMQEDKNKITKQMPNINKVYTNSLLIDSLHKYFYNGKQDILRDLIGLEKNILSSKKLQMQYSETCFKAYNKFFDYCYELYQLENKELDEEGIMQLRIDEISPAVKNSDFPNYFISWFQKELLIIEKKLKQCCSNESVNSKVTVMIQWLESQQKKAVVKIRATAKSSSWLAASEESKGEGEDEDEVEKASLENIFTISTALFEVKFALSFLPNKSLSNTIPAFQSVRIGRFIEGKPPEEYKDTSIKPPSSPKPQFYSAKK